MYVVRRYCRTGPFLRPKVWDWQDVRTFDDEQRAREHFDEIVRRRGYSARCRGYVLVAATRVEQSVIMSAWDYRH